MSASLDTNCLLRWLLGDLPEQTEIITGLLDSSQSFTVADAAIIEAIFVLEKVKKISRPAITQAISAIIAQGNIKCSRAIFNETMLLYAAHPKLSAVDCYLSIVTRQTGAMPLLTFDEKLANQAPGTKLLSRK